MNGMYIEEYLDHQHDTCFCSVCYGLDRPKKADGLINPVGWVGFALMVPRRKRKPFRGREFTSIWQAPWVTTYHGTHPDSVESILHLGHIGMPGDVLSNGIVLKASNSAGRSASLFLTTPTPFYAGLQ